MILTLNSKFTTMTVHDNLSELKQSAADLLSHSLGTAKRFDHLIDQQRWASTTSLKINDAERTDFMKSISKDEYIKRLETQIASKKIKTEKACERLELQN